MKIVLLILLLIPILIFQVFIITDALNIFMSTKKAKQNNNKNIVFLHEEKPHKKTNLRRSNFKVME